MYKIAQPFTAGLKERRPVFWNALKGIINKESKLMNLSLKG
jgi:hypothetical protein